MKIEVERILKLYGSCESPTSVALKMEIETSPHQVENMVYRIWEYLGTSELNKIFNAEGYELVKVKE